MAGKGKQIGLGLGLVLGMTGIGPSAEEVTPTERRVAVNWETAELQGSKAEMMARAEARRGVKEAPVPAFEPLKAWPLEDGSEIIAHDRPEPEAQPEEQPE